LHLQPPLERAQTALEPGNGTLGELFKGPMVGIRLLLSFFSNEVG
jgi:hypothetical protein